MRKGFGSIVLLWIVMTGYTPLGGGAKVYAQVSTSKPWTFWWWMGGIATDEDVRYNLLELKKSGIGGLHVIPIYGVKGYEEQFQPFLGDRWMRSFELILSEAKKLDLGVDLSNGSGWPFGGPNVSMQASAKKWELSGDRLVPVSTRQQVKRAGPGGQGYVVDPFDKALMSNYLTRFDSAFAGRDISHLRSVYSDSYEVYGANWTEKFEEEFTKRRGYEFQTVLPLFLDSISTLPVQLVKMDYQQTLSELLYETSKAWTDRSAQRKLKTRYQAHGSPGNLLDLYSLSTIPETESFGSSNFSIPLLRVDQDYPVNNFGRPDPLIMKFASSPAGVTGKRLVSSETCTWLANHFKVALSQVKPQVDELFTAGINHIFFHGTTFNPRNEAFPGWLFYASTHFGPSSHFYKELPLLNRYIENCQEILQNSETDNDVLIYFPVQDIWANTGSGRNGIHPLDVHHLDSWFTGTPFARVSRQLAEGGYSFDYISDCQLQDSKVVKGGLKAGGATYKALVIPRCTFLSPSTLDRLHTLGKQGIKILFDGELPQQVTGYAGHEKNSALFEQTKRAIRKEKANFYITSDLEGDLERLGVSREKLPSVGLSFIRKRHNGRKIYFITNLSNRFSEGWVELGKPGTSSFSGYDPLTGERFDLAVQKAGGRQQLYLSLLPGQSCFVREEPEAYHAITPPRMNREFAWQELHPAQWELRFLEGKPDYNRTFVLPSLQSWTLLSDTAAIFSGTARYSATVAISREIASKKDMILDLGNVAESAVVKVNGQTVGTVWSIPFRIKLPPNLIKEGENSIEIDVTNLSANYMRWYDRQYPGWRKFYDANIVDITYKPFNVAAWPVMPSGLVQSHLKIGYR